MKELIVLAVHGMGQRKPNFADGLEDKLTEYLGSEVMNKVSFQRVKYYSALQAPQDQLISDIWGKYHNRFSTISNHGRRFFMNSFSDATSLEVAGRRQTNDYMKIIKAVQGAMFTGMDECGFNLNVPVVIICHSLGAQVISNYFWDALNRSNAQVWDKNHNDFISNIDDGKLAYLKGNRVKLMFTTGCNIPLFLGGLAQRECFIRPSTQFSWLNYFDADDLLGWPLNELGPSYQFVVDKCVKVGGLISGNTPWSHTQYWTDKDVYQAFGDHIRGYLGM
ncbi:hypothetical protein AHAT_18780 [Agarivorans sp. Toyoura001]|uniref:hypothetical protein n=1 Tax=Agarivorans sp. Toyoura001 TaxID=2283141 RepID=UPI0010D1BC1D|nr:hypothetical protein [Agarivorans sp. Toyoura001]GDY25988.1 hypothetical protein AHAT_18780 [Agarivorans sp. Toyoura001]